MKLSILFLASLLAAGAAGACPTKIPAGLKSSNVGDDLVVNGLTMSIIQVEGAAAPADVLAQTEEAWKGGGYKVKRISGAGWEILSALSDKCLVTLQLAPGKSSFGYLSRNGKPIGSAMTPASAGMPLPGDARIMSSVASTDDGRPGLTVAMTTSMPLDGLSRYFHERLEKDSWGGIRMRKMMRAGSSDSSLMMTAQRKRERIDITVWPDKQTRVVMTVSSAL